MIYVDNAATSFYKPKEMIERVSMYLTNPGNPGRGAHALSLQASRLVYETREKIADFFDFEHPERVIFTSGITESLNMVIQGLIKKEDHVVTTFYEHNSVLRPLYKSGCEFSISDGSEEDIQNKIKENTKAVIINHISNVTGHIQDIQSIGKLCKDKGILCIVDSAQSAGLVPISMKDIDILCFTGHKGLLGMQGIGGLCIQEGIDIPPFKVGGSGILSFEQEHPKRYPERLEAGTLNVPGIVSLSASIDFIIQKGMESIYQHEKELASIFFKELKNIENVILYQDKVESGIVSLNIKGMDASKVSDALSYYYDIHTRAGAHCAPLVHNHFNTSSMVRFSFGLNNTMQDVYDCIQAIKEICE